MKRILFLLQLCMLLVLKAYCSVEVDGIWYNLNESGKTAEVTEGTIYSGSITIPSQITYNSTVYCVMSIGEWAFSGWSGLVSITIPTSVTSIGDYAFYSCSNLASITIPHSVTSIGREAFSFTAWLNNQPDGIVYAGLVACFYKGAIPNGTDIVLKEGTKGIAGDAFSGCSGLTSITIPNSVTSIGDYAFNLCYDLASITIPNSVTSIGESVFNGCGSLTSITIPNSVTSIGRNPFDLCIGLGSIKVEEGNTVYDSRNDCNAIINTKTNTLIAGCKNTIIPNSVLSIGDGAFSNCRGLKSIAIPNSVTSIGCNAFNGCIGLTSITIPNSVTSIKIGAFSDNELSSITVEEGNTVYDSRNDCNAIINTETNTLIAGCINTIIPNSVTSIGDSAFFACGFRRNCSIVIPNSVLSIGDGAFSYSYFSSIAIGDNVTSIGRDAFYSCGSLSSITIPNSVLSIGDRAFGSCLDLTSVIIGNSVTSIGFSAFWGCRGLTSIAIPNSVTSIGRGAFVNCVALTSIIIPNNVTSIEVNLFSGCSGLTSITIPNSVTSIEKGAFYGCVNIVDVYCFADPSKLTWNNNNDFKANKATKCHVFASDLDAYQTKLGHVNVTYVGDLPSQVETVDADKQVNEEVYDLNGRRLDGQLKTGIQIKNGRKFIVM